MGCKGSKVFIEQEMQIKEVESEQHGISNDEEIKDAAKSRRDLQHRKRTRQKGVTTEKVDENKLEQNVFVKGSDTKSSLTKALKKNVLFVNMDNIQVR